MKKFYLLSICLALFFSVLLVGNLEAATYYIDGSNGNDSNPGTLALQWKTIGKANSRLKAGDTVYIRAGTYSSDSSEQINPANSGTSGNYITYQNYNDEVVTITGGSLHHADLSNKSYIKIDGIRFYVAERRWILMENSHYNIIQNCEFDESHAWGGIYMFAPCNYNKFVNNTFIDAPINAVQNGTYPVDFIMSRGARYNVFEANTFGKCSHVALEFQGDFNDYNVIRNNVFRNEYHTGLNLFNGADYILVDANEFYDQGEDYLNDPSPTSKRLYNPGIVLVGSNCIIRRNLHVNDGIGFDLGPNKERYSAQYNRVYNNTYYACYRNHYTGSDYSMPHNVFKNNIYSYGVEYDVYFGYRNSPGSQTWTNNNLYGGGARNRYKSTYDSLVKIESTYPSEWSNNQVVNPNFSDVDGRDFTLQSISPMINAGGWLTTISSTTANGQTSFVVDDTGYFYDGWGIPGETGDVIKTEHGQVTTIQRINYATNTITVSPAIDIFKGEGLALNYLGSAPDIGAYEYGIAGAQPAPPTGLKMLLGN